MADEQATDKSEPAPNLTDQYDLGDSSFDPELDGTPSKQTSPEPTEKPTKTLPPKDPKTGKFLKRDAAPEPVDEPKTQPKPKPSARLARMAREFGVSDDEIENSDPEQLEAIVEHETRRLVQERATLDGKVEKRDELDFGIDENAYDPQLFNSLRGHFKSRDDKILALESKLDQIEKQTKHQASEAIYEQCDRAFAKHKDILGDGGRYDIDPKSPEYEKRMAVLASVQRDRGPGTLGHKIDRAVQRLFGAAKPKADPGDEQVDEPPANGAQRFTKEQWNNGALGKPTGRNGHTEPKGPNRAAKAVAEKMRERGITEDDFEGIEEAGLPG